MFQVLPLNFKLLFCLPKPANISDCFLPYGRDGAKRRHLENPWLLLKGWGAGEDAARRDEEAQGCWVRTGGQPMQEAKKHEMLLSCCSGDSLLLASCNGDSLPGQQWGWIVGRRWVLWWHLTLPCLGAERQEEVGFCRWTSENPTSPFPLVLWFLLT